VRANSRHVSVQLAEAPGRHAARLSGDVPAATQDLPSPALGERAGGPLPVDPADAEGRRALQPVFVFEVTLPAQPIGRIGQRAWVRFDHGIETLAARAYRRGGQLLLKHFNPST
jgi:putative peptide zinc metalloprotease protein